MNEVRTIETSAQRLLLTVEDYRILDEAGAFDTRPNVELIEGVILTVSPQQNMHAIAKSELAFRLAEKLKELGLPYRAIVEGTLQLSPKTAVNPDITIASEQPTRGYIDPRNVVLTIEVANTSEKYDTGEKAALYALAGISEYWVLSLGQQRLIRHWEPDQDGYRHTDSLLLGASFTSVLMPSLTVKSDGLI